MECVERLRPIKYRIYPTKEQKEFIEKTFGASRFVYNKLLEKFLSSGKVEPYGPLKKEFPFLKEADSLALANARLNLIQAIKNYKAKTAGRPKFKKKKSAKQTYRTNNVGNTIRFSEDFKYLRLSKIGFIKIRAHRKFDGEIRSVTVTRTKTEKYFATVLFKTKVCKLPNTNSTAAIDLGLTSYATVVTDKGLVYKVEHPKFLEPLLRKIKRVQKKLSRKVKGSKRYEKQRRKLAKLYEKYENSMNDFLHKLSWALIRDNQAIGVEDLSVKELLEKSSSSLSRSIWQSGWSKFLGFLEYKAEWYGRVIIRVNRYFPSSKLCNVCGAKNNELKLSDREWVCPVCGTEHDRDINAAMNILKHVGLGRPELTPVESVVALVEAGSLQPL